MNLLNLKSMRTLRGCCALLLAASLGTGTPVLADSNALTDDKSVSIPTGWSTYTDRTVAQINTLLGNNQARLTDIEPFDTAGNRFTVTMVQNAGVYAVPGWSWHVGLTAAQIGPLLTQNKGRLIDIEPYPTSVGLRFAVIMVSNTGAAGRGWGYLISATAGQVATHLQDSRQRLIDLKSYVEGGVKKYTIISIVNSGADKKTWQYWLNQTAAQVTSKVNSFQGRITSLERQSDGTYNFIQIKNTGGDSHYWRYYFGLSTLTQATQVAAQFGSRVFDVETYVSGGKRLYNALMISNVNAETARIRAAFGDTLVKANGLPNGQWSAYLKPLGAAAAIDLNGDRRFEPASAIKAVHNMAAMRRIRAGTLSLTSPLTYFNYPSDTSIQSDGTQKGLTGNACPSPGDESTANDVASTVNFGKENMMTISDNRTTRAITLLFGTGANQTAKGISGIAALETIAFNDGQMTSTFIDQPRIGCAYADGRRNQTTLADFGRLYERVENGTLLGTGIHRTEFYQPMNGGAFDNTSGNESAIRQVVAAEGASLGKTKAQVNDFISRIEWRTKGGGYGISCNNPFTPCAKGFISISTLAGRLTLPRRLSGSLTERDYVFGNYSTDLNACRTDAPSGQSDSCVQCPTCKSTTVQSNALSNVTKEQFRTIIRENLATF